MKQIQAVLDLVLADVSDDSFLSNLTDNYRSEIAPKTKVEVADGCQLQLIPIQYVQKKRRTLDF